MDDFEVCLKDLNRDFDNAAKVEIILDRIGQYFMEEKASTSVDLLIFLLFQEHGILSFIKKAAPISENRANVLNSFRILTFITTNFDRFCAPHAGDLSRFCLYMGQCDVSAIIRETSLKLLKCLFKPSLIFALDVTNIVTTIKNILSRNASIVQTVQEQLLSVVGVIFEKVPESSQHEKDWFLNFFFQKMKENLRNTSESKSSLVMTGCFEGLYGYLVNFSLADKNVVDVIYSCLKKFSKTKSHTKMTERSALKIIRDHYSIFSMYIYTDFREWCNVFSYWISKVGSDRQLGFAGLVSTYRSVACELKNLSPELCLQKVNEIVDELLKTNKWESTIGVLELISTGFASEDLANRGLQMVMKQASRTENDSYMYLSINLSCIAKYLSRGNVGTAVDLIRLRSVAISLIENYPRTSAHFKKHMATSLAESFYNVARRGRQELSDYAKEVIYQGVMRSCSHGVHVDGEENTKEEVISHKSYLPIWIYILNMSSSSSKEGELKNKVAVKVFDEYVASFLRINSKLDLTIQAKNLEIPEAVRPEDFNIFINNVNLFVDVIDGTEDLYLLKKWLPEIFTKMIESSRREPIISGFYKVITVTLKVAQKLKFFSESTQKILECSTLLRRFLRDVSAKVVQYKGDLQVSCFETLLAAPSCLIESIVKELDTIFKVILRVGFGYLPLLDACIEALERWYHELPKESVEQLLKNVLPHFDVFLQSKENKRFETQRNIFKLESIGKDTSFSLKATGSRLLALQKKFLYFLGKLNIDVSRELIQSVDDDINVDSDKSALTYDMPFVNQKLRLQLKDWIPRVIELSLSSGDRDTRITACELLHSVVMLTLGNMKQMNGELNPLFQTLLSTCLSLGCDSDSIVLQIYEPLLFQMAHYFSVASKDFSETEIFINCLMDSVSQPFNSSLREFAAKLVKEFTEWSVKDTDSLRFDGHCNNVDALLRSTCSLAVHPDHNKRCGAAIIFNKICSLIRNETTLLDSHCLMFYYSFMECLAMCTEHDDTIHIVGAIEEVKKTFTEEGFSERNTNRKIPPGFTGRNLVSLLEWTFKRCSHVRTNTRRLSMQTVEELLPNVEGCRSVKEFVTAHIGNACIEYKSLKVIADEEDYLEWIEYNGTFFDYCHWLLKKDILTEKQLEDADDAISHFAEKITSIKFPENSTTAFAIVYALEFLVARGITIHNVKAIDLIKMCLWTSKAFIFSDCGINEKLEKALMDLIPAAVKVQSQFFELSQSLTWFESVAKCLQARESLSQLLQPLNALKIIHNLCLWDSAFGQKIRGDHVIKTIFESLFVVRHRRHYCIVVEPRDRRLLGEFVEFILKIIPAVENIIDLVTNSEEVTKEETFEVVTKGEYFIELFEEELFDYFVLNSESSLSAILCRCPKNALNLLYSVAMHADRSGLSTAAKKKFSKDLYKKWSMLNELSNGNGQLLLLLSLVRAVCQMSSETLEDSVCNAVFRLMSNSEIEWRETEIIFEFLPYLSSTDETVNDRLLCSLSSFINRFDEFDPRITTLYNAMLRSFKLTRSLVVLQQLLLLLKRFKNLDREDAIKAVAEVGRLDVPEDHIHQILVFLQNGVPAGESTEPFLAELLRNCSSSSALLFLLNNLNRLSGIIRDGDNAEAKMSALNTIQSCLVRVTRAELENLSAEVREYFQNLVRICAQEVSKDGGNESERKFACARFNTLCTLITTRTDNPLPYKSLIFKNDFSLLSGLVDRNRQYNLAMDFEELPKRKKIVTSLKKRIMGERRAKPVTYLQTLYESSLQVDAMKFASIPEEIEKSEMEVELEMDDLNCHECMPTIIGIIKHIIEAKISPEEDEPFWLKSLVNRLRSYDSSENEKIFVLKLMCNLEKHLKPFAAKISTYLLEQLLQVFHGRPINYLVMDVVTMVFGWNPDLSGKPWTELVLYIVSSSDSFRTDIINNNLEMLKLIVESCREELCFRMLSKTVTERLKVGKIDSATYVNLHFCRILLANSIPPWTADSAEEQFFATVLRHFHHEDKNGKLAAEICGLSLSYLERNRPGLEQVYAEEVRARIKMIFASCNDNGIPYLYAVHNGFPKMSRHFLRTVQMAAWNTAGKFKTQCLKMLLDNVDSLSLTNDLFFKDMLSSRDLSDIDLTLKIILKINRITEEFAKAALSFSDSKNSSVRSSVYHIAENLLKKTSSDQRSRMVLLKGLTDSDPELSERCLQFWYDRVCRPTVREQFFEMMTQLYTPETEMMFLYSAARLMIRSAFNSEDYQKAIFNHPLKQGSTSTSRNILKTLPSTMVPMFASTIPSMFAPTLANQSQLQEEEPRKKRFVRKPRIHWERKKKTELEKSDVDILRCYSDGDFPEIQIKHSDVLKPLELLTFKDPQIGLRFLASLYDGFAKDLSGAEALKMYSHLRNLVLKVMEESSGSDPTIIAFLFHVILKCGGQLQVDPDAVAKFGKLSGWFSVASLVIEDAIIFHEGDDDIRRKTREVTVEDRRWLCLADLCRFSNEFQVLRGIFLDKLVVESDTGEAIRSEMVCNWWKASKLYESTLSAPSRFPVDVQTEAYLSCLSRLSDWEKLNSHVVNRYNVEPCSGLPDGVLPLYVRSEAIKLLESNGDMASEIFRTMESDLRKQFLEEMTIAHFCCGENQWANYYQKQMCLNFLSSWSHWNKWSNNLREAKLMHLSLMSELQQSLSILEDMTTSEREEGLEILSRLWIKTCPKEKDELLHWDVKLRCRRRFLTMLKKNYPFLDLSEIHSAATHSEVQLIRAAIAQKNFRLSDELLKKMAVDEETKHYRGITEALHAEVTGSIASSLEALSLLQQQIGDGRFAYEKYETLRRIMLLLRSGNSSEENIKLIAERLNVPRSEVGEALAAKELEYLEKMRNALEGTEQKDLLSKTYLDIAKYHRGRCGYTADIAKCLFRSMSLGNREARRFFCFLLTEDGLSRDWLLDEDLRRKCAAVPIWMFLMWKNQLLANLDTGLYPFVKDLLLTLSEEYPNAVRYSYALSRERGSGNRAFAEKLDRILLSDPHHSDFITALSFVASPDVILRYHLEIISNLMATDWDKTYEAVRDLKERMFGEKYRQFRGNIFECLARVEPMLDRLFELPRDRNLWNETILTIMNIVGEINVRHNLLKSYSPWLSDFRQDSRIEVPGQYDGEQKPTPKSHVTVSSFKYNVFMMKSKCKPIRLTILGNDAKEYRFLVKFGEDLRQDERIQQTFRQVNHVLASDIRTNRLRLDTYDVVPLSKSFGLIELVNHVRSLQELFDSVKDIMERVQREQMIFFNKDDVVTSAKDAHLNGYLNIGRDESVARFLQSVNSFEWDLLRKIFWQMSTCPEQFVCLRKNFAVSLAVIYVAHWFVGIGDRHLDNTLVSLRTGRAVGIDFGCAFGFATEFLTPPELLPFRLTPQIINLFKPMGASGLLKETMIHCVAAFRREQSILLSTLQVFAIEPTLNWLEKSEIRDEKSSPWDPRRKMAMLQEKLNGVDPIKIFRDDLIAGHSHSKYLEKYLEVLDGVGASPAVTLTEEQQVERLIHLATDLHVLSKTYVGWNPWL